MATSTGGMLSRIVNALTLRQRNPDRSSRSISWWPMLQQAGVRVDHDNALTHSAVWAGVRLVAETMGVLNIHLYQQRPDGGKRRRTDLRNDQMLRRRPNPEMSAGTFKEVLTGHAMTWGNGYAEIERDQAGRPLNLWPLLPDRTRPVRDTAGVLWYEYQTFQGERFYLPADDVFHLKGFGFDGVQGYDIVSYMAATIGHGMAAEQFSASYFQNGTHLSGGLFHKRRLSADAKNALREEFVAAYAGPRKAFRMAVFEEGLEWKSFALSPEASQLIEARKLSVIDLARFLNVPLHKIKEMEHATFSNIEHQAIEYVTDTILPWAVRWEQEADAKLITPGLAVDHCYKVNVSTLARGDMKTRYEAYKMGREGGWLCANQIAEMEDLEPIGPAGDVYIVPMNFMNAERLLDPPEPEPSAEPPTPEYDEDDDEQENPENATSQNIGRAFALDVANRVLRRERNEMTRQLERIREGKTSFGDAFESFARGQMAYAEDALLPVAHALGQQLGGVDDDRLRNCVTSVMNAHMERCRSSWYGAHMSGMPFQPEAYAHRLADGMIEAITLLRAGKCKSAA